MKKLLKAKTFYNVQALADFVNENEITRENIQAIVCHGCLMLFYWEITL